MVAAEEDPAEVEAATAVVVHHTAAVAAAMEVVATKVVATTAEGDIKAVVEATDLHGAAATVVDTAADEADLDTAPTRLPPHRP